MFSYKILIYYNNAVSYQKNILRRAISKESIGFEFKSEQKKFFNIDISLRISDTNGECNVGSYQSNNYAPLVNIIARYLGFSMNDMDLFCYGFTKTHFTLV